MINASVVFVFAANMAAAGLPPTDLISADMVASGANSAGVVIGGLDLARGAIAGALVLSVAFLAGLAIIGRTATAICALLMAGAGATLLFIGLGLAPQPTPIIYGVFQAIFAASALIFVSSAVSAAKDNALLGSLMFAGAISIVGIAVINIVREGQAAGLLQTSAFAGGAVAIVVALFGAVKGEAGARLILPGGVLAIGAPFIGPVIGPFVGGLATEAVFAAGILSAALLGALNAVVSNLGAVNMRLPRRSVNHSGHGGGQTAAHNSAHAHFPGPAPARASLHRQDQSLSENQLAQVLDYTGVAVWDWSDRAARQTESFCQIMGAGCEGDFTPESMLDFIKAEHRPGFEIDVLGKSGEDGSFDRLVGLVTGKTVRMRGARAVDANGDLERVIVFVEETSEASHGLNANLLQNAAASLTGAAAMASKLGGGRATPLSVSPSEVAAALQAGELAAGFQKIVSLRDGSTVGYEALVRWPAREKAGRDTPPADDIIRAAELAGEADALARLMIGAAAQKIADERDSKEFGKTKPFVSVNVSIGQASALGFVEAVRGAIDAHDLPSKSLVLELTEVEKIEDTAIVAATFGALKDAGAALAFDDFGAGFSSLGNLHKYAFDYLKIDRSFIDRLNSESGAEKTVAALARLGREFGMTIIAEGVEQKKTGDAARIAGCQFAQGFLYGEAIIGPQLTPVTPRGETQTNPGPENTGASKNPGATSADQSDTGQVSKNTDAGAPAPEGDGDSKSKSASAPTDANTNANPDDPSAQNAAADRQNGKTRSDTSEQSIGDGETTVDASPEKSTSDVEASDRIPDAGRDAIPVGAGADEKPSKEMKRGLFGARRQR